MTPLTNRQQCEDDDKLLELLRLLDSHPQRHDLIRDVDICQTYGENAQFLVLSKEGVAISRAKHIEWPKDTHEWTQAQWDAYFATCVIHERIRDYRACVALFRRGLSVQRLQEILAQLGE